MSERERTRLLRIVITSVSTSEDTDPGDHFALPRSRAPHRPYVEAGSVRFEDEPPPPPPPAPNRYPLVVVAVVALLVIIILVIVVVAT